MSIVSAFMHDPDLLILDEPTSGLPIGFLLIQMLSNANSEIKVLKCMTIFSLFKLMDIIHGENVIMPMIVLAIITCVLYVGGIIIFDKKDLPI